MIKETLIIILFLTAIIPSLNAEDISIAEVNGVYIRLYDYNKIATPALEEYIKKTPLEERDTERFKSILLSQMIDDQILKQEAHSRNILVSNDELIDGLEKVKNRFHSENEFNKELDKEGLTYSNFKKRIKEQLMVMKLIEQVIGKRDESDIEGQKKQQNDYVEWLDLLRAKYNIKFSNTYSWAHFVNHNESQHAKKNNTSRIENIAVADFEARGVSLSDAMTISDFIRDELVNNKRYTVMDRKNMELILSEQKFQMSGCTSQGCAVKIGKMINVEAVVVGNVSRLMDTYVISASIVAVENGEILASHNENAKSVNDIKNACILIGKNISK